MFLNKINKTFLCITLALCTFVYTQEVAIGFGAVTDAIPGTCSDAQYDNETDCLTNGGTWTDGHYATMELTIDIPCVDPGDGTCDSAWDVGGFQFDILGTTLGAAYGGLAGDAGFTISTGGSTILGFSFTGGVIAAGSVGTLCTVDFTADALEEIVIDFEG